MVKLQALFLLLLLCPFTVLGKPSLEVQLKKSTGELGRPVYLKIIGQDIKTDLSMLSLHSLNEQFVLDSKDLDTEIVEQDDQNSMQKSDGAIRRQTLSLKLYPRQMGELLIPSFSIEKLSSSEKMLMIQDAATDGTKISLDWNLTSSEVWQREQIVVSITLTSPEQHATIKPAKQTVDGFEITPLPVKREWTKDKQRGRSRITAGWSLLPLKSGNMDVDLPAIEYHLSGVIRRTFYLPEINLTIHPLPTYLPPTIPVGKVQIESSVTPDGMLNTNELAYWNISIDSASLTPYWLPPVLRQIRSDDSIHFFPATSKRSMYPDNEGVHGRVTHTVPFKPLRNGYIDLPPLNLQYFDPDTGRLESIVHKGEKSLSTGILIHFLTVLFLIAVVLYLSRRLYRYFHTRFLYQKQRLFALETIRQATTHEDVLAGLRLAGKAEGWPSNLTLSEWLVHWTSKYQSNQTLKDCIETLSDCCYGQAEGNHLQALISSLTELLTTPQKVH